MMSLKQNSCTSHHRCCLHHLQIFTAAALLKKIRKNLFQIRIIHIIKHILYLKTTSPESNTDIETKSKNVVCVSYFKASDEKYQLEQYSKVVRYQWPKVKICRYMNIFIYLN